MAIKTLGKAALKAKRQAIKDAAKRSKKTMRFKEGTIIEKSKAIKNPKETLKKFDKKLDRIEELSKKKEVKIKNYAGFNPKQIQLSNAESNIFKEFKGIRNLVKGFGEGSKIKNISQAKKFREKLVKQAEGQKLKDKQTKEEAFKNVKVTKSKEKLKPKTKKPRIFKKADKLKKGGLIKRKAGGPCKPRGVGAALRGFKMKGSK